MTTSAPEKITYHRKDKTLRLKWHSEEFSLTAELLRVYSPSADYKNLGDSPPVFESGKSSVQINKMWLVRTEPYLVDTVDPSMIGSRSR